jgi:hypothetical protein
MGPSYLVEGTPLEDHLQAAGLLVKREDLSCPPPGPPFSKTRGVLRHVQARYAEGVRTFGVLDTSHSQAGHAVAQACRHVGAKCLNFFPVFKRELTLARPAEGLHLAIPNKDGDGEVYAPLRPPSLRALELGAEMRPLWAGRSAVLFHQAKKQTLEAGGYMMPNALKLPETVEETAREVERTFERASKEHYRWLSTAPWVVASSSGTIAAGVVAGLHRMRGDPPLVIVHMGYDRPEDAVTKYIREKSGQPNARLKIVQEGYAYADQARGGEGAPIPPWPCNPFYDLKALRWWLKDGRRIHTQAVLWNIG